MKPTFKQYLGLIDMTKVNQIQKGSVAADKQPRLNLAVLGISIGQEQSTGDTSRVGKGTAMGKTKPTPMLRRPIN